MTNNLRNFNDTWLSSKESLSGINPVRNETGVLTSGTEIHNSEINPTGITNFSHTFTAQTTGNYTFIFDRTQLCKYLVNRYPIEFIGGHQDVYCNHTECPGNKINEILDILRVETGTGNPNCLHSDTKKWYQFWK